MCKFELADVFKTSTFCKIGSELFLEAYQIHLQQIQNKPGPSLMHSLDCLDYVILVLFHPNQVTLKT